MEPGKLLTVWDENLQLGKKLIINFPTKVHWRYPSKYECIEKDWLPCVNYCKRKKKSVAIPPLGSGNGGLDWNKVKLMIEQALSGLETEIMIYEPNAAIIKAILQKQESKKEVAFNTCPCLIAVCVICV
ncbi:MAG: macro domain-containing protein [Saprospirales bacterium]|nr:macro domain-containing protein [Saprospirales bacterium]